MHFSIVASLLTYVEDESGEDWRIVIYICMYVCMYVYRLRSHFLLLEVVALCLACGGWGHLLHLLLVVRALVLGHVAVHQSVDHLHYQVEPKYVQAL